MEEAIENAFKRASDDDFDQLIEVTGAADMNDARDGAPCVNLQHHKTGGGVVFP